MCKEVDHDSENSSSSPKIKSKDIKIIPDSEEEVAVAQDNSFLPPKHETAYTNKEFEIESSNIEEISLSGLEKSDNHTPTNIKGKLKESNANSSDSNSNRTSDSD